MKALEQLCHDILTRAQTVYGRLDSATGVFMPQYARMSAEDAMQDLLEEFLPQFNQLMAYQKPLSSGESTPSPERPP